MLAHDPRDADSACIAQHIHEPAAVHPDAVLPARDGRLQARLSELGERLVDAGWDVEVLTALPNYPTGKIFSQYDPRAAVVEQIGRMRTIRVPLYTAKTGFIKRLRCYFSFVASARRYGPRLCLRPDLLWVESPPLFIGYAARSLARRWRCPYVFNVSDLWPESAIRMGIVKPGVATWLAERLELSLYRHAAAVTGQSSEIIESVRQRSPHTRTAVVTNGVAPARFGKSMADAAARELVGHEPGPIFIYAGLLGHAQGLDQVLDIAAQMPADSRAGSCWWARGPNASTWSSASSVKTSAACVWCRRSRASACRPCWPPPTSR